MTKLYVRQQTNKEPVNPAEAEYLAAIRWYVCQIEMLALERYSGNRGAWNKVEPILRDTIKKLYASAIHPGWPKSPPNAANLEMVDCPWPLSADGKCEPPV